MAEEVRNIKIFGVPFCNSFHKTRGGKWGNTNVVNALIYHIINKLFVDGAVLLKKCCNWVIIQLIPKCLEIGSKHFFKIFLPIDSSENKIKKIVFTEAVSCQFYKLQCHLVCPLDVNVNGEDLRLVVKEGLPFTKYCLLAKNMIFLLFLSQNLLQPQPISNPSFFHGKIFTIFTIQMCFTAKYYMLLILNLWQVETSEIFFLL